MTPDCWPYQFNPTNDLFDLSSISLSDLFSQLTPTPQLFIERKNHVLYLQNYLHRLGAKYVVAERNYISKDYLTDYSSYYASCYEVYEKLCVRLHFFASTESKIEFLQTFERAILDQADVAKDFWAVNYLGFVVVKPIPKYFIGQTILRHKNFDENGSEYDSKRKCWGTKDYKVHLFGKEILFQSLAFQEQDGNVAACATIAIWSMLQCAAEDYYVILQSPGEITRKTGIIAHDGNRLIPNKGLSVFQMANAITQNNLATEARTVADSRGQDSFNTYLKKLIYAYAPLQIPIIFLFRIPIAKGDREGEGHAVAICGYEMMETEIGKRRSWLRRLFSKQRDSRFVWRADAINKILVHDDQWGPYAEMVLSGKNRICCLWDRMGNGKSYSNAALISVFPKVRVAYDDIQDKVLGLHQILEDQFRNRITGDMVWEIQLFLSEKFKQQILKSSDLDNSLERDRQIRYRFVTRNFPKYIWVATVSIDEFKLFQFIFDATGLSGSNITHTVLGYSGTVTEWLLQTLRQNRTVTRPSFLNIFDSDIDRFIRIVEQMN